MEYEIVVAHYNENLNWLRRLPSNSIHVYNKGPIANIPCIQHVLPNIGREAHTYLTYIIERYESLPDVVFFTQGRIYDHFRASILNTFLNITTHSNNYRFSKSESGFRLRHWGGHDLKPAECVFDEWFHKYVDPSVNIEDGIQVYFAAIFSVCKKQILSRAKSYYEDLIKQLDVNNTEVAHYFERSWYYIFNLHRIEV